MKTHKALAFVAGYTGALAVRNETSFCCSAHGELALLYASDLHLNRWNRERLSKELAVVASVLQPAVILLGGDLVDSSSSVPHLANLVRALTYTAPVLAVSGNHDRWCGLGRVSSAVTNGGGYWLEGSSFSLGPRYPDVLVLSQEALDSSSDLVEEHRCRILLAHEPAAFRRAVARNVSLTLAGHLHGGQVVLWTARERLYPGYLFNHGHVLRSSVGNCELIVSRGASDSFPLRWNCPREVLLVRLTRSDDGGPRTGGVQGC